MSNNPLIPQSKLPNLGTTIFTQMSALAQQHQAINLSQGFPDFDGPLFLQERLAYHVAQGANQYAPMTGVPPLREAIAGVAEEGGQPAGILKISMAPSFGRLTNSAPSSSKRAQAASMRPVAGLRQLHVLV